MGNDGFQVVSGGCSSYVRQEDLASFQLNLIDEANALFKDHNRMKVPLETQLRHLYHQAECNSTTVHQLLRQHQIAQGEHLADRILSREEAMDSQTNFRVFDRLPTKLKISAKDVAARNRYVNLELRLHFLELPIFTPPVPDHLIENVVVTWIDFVHAKDHQRSKFRYRLRLTENAAGAFLDQMAANLKVILKETRAPDAFAAIEQRHPRSCFRFNEDKTLKEDGIDDLSVKDRFVAVIDGDILVEGQRLGFGLAIHEADHIFKALTDLCHQYASITYEKMLVSSDDSDLLVVGLEVLLHRILPSKENRRLQLSHQVHQLVDIQEAMFDLDLDQDTFPVYFTIQRRDGFQGLPGMGSKTALPVVKAAEAYTVKYFDSAASQAASSSSGTSSIETNGNEDDEERDEIFLRKEPGMGKEILNRIPIRDPIHAAFSRVLRCPVLADNEGPLESRPQCILLFAIAHLSATGRYKYRDQDIADCIQKQDLDTEEAKEFIFVELVELLLAYLDMYVTSNQTTAEDADTLSDQVPKSGKIAADWIPDSTKPRSVIAGERLRDVTVYDNSPASLRLETSPACPRDNAAGDDYDGPSKKMIHSSIAPTPGPHKDKRGINHPRMMRLGKPVIIPSLPSSSALEAAQHSFGKKKKLILNSDRFPKEVKDQEMDIDETDSEKNDGNDDEDQEMEDAQSLQPLSSKAKGKQRRIDNNPTGSSSNVKPKPKRKGLETVKVNKDTIGHGKKAKSNSNPSTKPQYEVSVNHLNPILNKFAFHNRNYLISKYINPDLKPFISSMELSNQSSLFLVTAAFTSINTTLKRLFAVELRDSEDFRRFGGLMVHVFKDFAAGMYAALKGLETSKPTFDENRPSDLQQDRKASHLLSTAPINSFNSLVSHWLPDTLLPILRPHSNFLKENVERESSHYRIHLSNAAFSHIEVHLTDVLSASASGIGALAVICSPSTTRRELFSVGKARLGSILLFAPNGGAGVDANDDDSDDEDGDEAEEEEDESKGEGSYQKSSKEIQQEKELRQDQSKRLKAAKKIYQSDFHRHSSGPNPLTDPALIQPWLTQVVKAVQGVDELSLQQIDHVRILSAALHQVNQAFLQTTRLFHASNQFSTLQDLITTSDSDVKALHVGLIRMFPIDQEVFGGSLKRRKTIPDCSTFIVRHRISDGVMQRSLSAPELEIQDVPKSINHLIKALFFSMDLVDFTPPIAEDSRPQKKVKLGRAERAAERELKGLGAEAGPSLSRTRRGGRGGQNTAEPEEVTNAREAVASKEIADKARLDNTGEERWESKLSLARQILAGWSVRSHLLHDDSLFEESCSPIFILSSNIQDSELILSKLKELKLLAGADYEPLLAEIKAAQGRIGGRVVKIHEDVITRCRSLSLKYFHLIKDALFPDGGGPQLAEGKLPVKEHHWVPISKEMVRKRGHLFMIHLIFSGGPGLDPFLFHRTFTMTKGYMNSTASDLRVVVGRKLGQREGDAPLKFRDFFESLEDSPAKKAFEDCIGRTLTPIDLSLLRSSRIRFTLPPLIIGDPETIGKRMKERKLTPGGTAPLWEVGSVDLAIRYLTALPGDEAKKKALGLTSGSETDADLALIRTMVCDERKIRGQEIGQDPNARLSNVASSLDGQDWIVRRAQSDQHPSAYTDGGSTQTHTAFCREVTVELQDGSQEEMTYTERTSFTHRIFSHLVDRFAERIAGIEREYSPSKSNGSAGAAYQAAVYHTNGRLQLLKGGLRARTTQIKDWFLHELWVLCGRPERWAELRPTWTIGAADFSSALRHKGMTLNFFFTLMEWVIPRMEPYVDIRLNEEFLSSRTAPGGLRSEAPKAGEGSKRPFLLGKAAQDGEGVARNSVRWPKTENGDRLTKMVFFEEERWNEGSEEWFTAGCLLPRDHASCLRFRDDRSHMIAHDRHPHTASRAPRVPHLSKVQKRRQQEEEQIQREKSPEV